MTSFKAWGPFAKRYCLEVFKTDGNLDILALSARSWFRIYMHLSQALKVHSIYTYFSLFLLCIYSTCFLCVRVYERKREREYASSWFFLKEYFDRYSYKIDGFVIG